MKAELKLNVSESTIARTLNRAGVYWRPAAKKTPLTNRQLLAKRPFVGKLLDHAPGWWEKQMHLVFDGVTLTKAPKGLTGRQKHAAQSIRHMWMKDSDRHGPQLHMYNRYGVQLGDKVPFWGGFTGTGVSSFKLWSPKPKMTNTEWARHVPALRKAVDKGQQVGLAKTFA